MSDTDTDSSPRKRRSGSEKRQRDSQVKLSLLGKERAVMEVLRQEAGLKNVQEWVMQKVESDPEYRRLRREMDLATDGLTDLAAVS